MGRKNEPHHGIPHERLTDEQRFDRLVFWRNRAISERAQNRKYTAAAFQMHGAAIRPHLPPGTAIDSEGMVRFDDEDEQDATWREAVGASHAALGDVILDRLPPDTIIDPATREVIIDPDKDAWL